MLKTEPGCLGKGGRLKEVKCRGDLQELGGWCLVGTPCLGVSTLMKDGLRAQFWQWEGSKAAVLLLIKNLPTLGAS